MFLARSKTYDFPSGLSFQTPLLVPSLSSKGFSVGRGSKSDVADIFNVAKELVTSALLVSAYDINYYLDAESVPLVASLTIVDSGGYETSRGVDLSAVYNDARAPQAWDYSSYERVLSQWPAQFPAVFVTHDTETDRVALDVQIERAREFAYKCRPHLSTFLIKPETSAQKEVQIQNVVARANDIAKFDIIGVTEKELGASPLDRMRAIAKLRLALDDAEASCPIHVFGSLDPIQSVLHFLAGAEIFDGLTWLRYGYRAGIAAYVQNAGSLEFGIEARDDDVKRMMMSSNLRELNNMQNNMKTFCLDHDFERLGSHSAFFRNAFDILRTRERRLK